MDAATLDGPEGRIQVTPGSTFYPGTRFMNVDLARLLDKVSANLRQKLE